MNISFAHILSISFLLSATACSKSPDWVQIERPIPDSDTSIWYEPSSIRKIGTDKAIVNVKWANQLGQDTFKGVMRFNCQQRLFVTTDTWTNSDGRGFKPYISQYEAKESDVLPNGAIEAVMDAACD